jgi:homoserine kinase
MHTITVKAPSSTANLGPGFDVFGLALDAFFDQVTISKIAKKQILIKTMDSIPLNPKKNTAGIVAKTMIKKFNIKYGLEIKIKKGVPVGFGLGSSASSAAATVVAFDKLFKLNLDPISLVKFAGIGEKASAGSIHYDNVAASVLGGFVIVKTKPLDVIRIEPPKDLVLCVAIPQLKVPKKKTQIARSVVPTKINLRDSVQNLSNAATIVAGFMKKDSKMIGQSIKDVIIEPARQHMIPGYKNVKKYALNAGALGVTISGAGPSVIAFTTSSANSKKICTAMQRGFSTTKIKCKTIICKPSKGAFVIKN